MATPFPLLSHVYAEKSYRTNIPIKHTQVNHPTKNIHVGVMYTRPRLLAYKF